MRVVFTFNILEIFWALCAKFEVARRDVVNLMYCESNVPLVVWTVEGLKQSLTGTIDCVTQSHCVARPFLRASARNGALKAVQNPFNLRSNGARNKAT